MINVLLRAVGSKGGNKSEITTEIYSCDHVRNTSIHVYAVDFIIFTSCLLICGKQIPVDESTICL